MTHVSSLYLHVPFCKHLCNYCDFYKKSFNDPKNQIEEFHQFLKQSWIRHEDLMSEYGFNWSELDTLYFGGGTPSLWGTNGSQFWSEFFARKIKLKASAEFTMEIDPGTWSEEMIGAWKKLGLNRISIGTQTLDPNFLKIMDRSHSLEDSHSLLRFCHQNSWNFSLDFLLGLPFSQEKKRDIKAELDTLLSYCPKHISLYILNARSKYPYIQNMPDDEFIRQEYLFVSDYLKLKGFEHYEVSNFALPGFRAKHNMKYWKSETVAALGPTGTGYFAKDANNALRYKWKVSRGEIELEKLTFKELSLEKVYLSLRTDLGWTPTAINEPLENVFKGWNKLGYSNLRDGNLKLSSLGFLMLDSLMDDLFNIGL